MYFVPCIVIQLCNVNQKNALFKLKYINKDEIFPNTNIL